MISFAVYQYKEYKRLENVPMPSQLHPVVEDKKDALIEAVEQIGVSIIITDGFRTTEEQKELYALGRTAPGNIVTYAQGGESYHNYGLAIDFAIRLENGDVIWDIDYDGNNNGTADWTEVVERAKQLGFEWGGDWHNFQDYPHLQMDFDLSIHDLQRGYRPDTEN
ncbi:M15 family metallopeptidase [Radiobacillus sp. PE A8.2]|uniref:M15 family metallopeptidase n=1 Tax=Radiobacillus sp. PE A8.2 TaxID=3380349 RepID=UPI00389053A2